jgi:hypothetical protein
LRSPGRTQLRNCTGLGHLTARLIGLAVSVLVSNVMGAQHGCTTEKTPVAMGSTRRTLPDPRGNPAATGLGRDWVEMAAGEACRECLEPAAAGSRHERIRAPLLPGLCRSPSAQRQGASASGLGRWGRRPAMGWAQRSARGSVCRLETRSAQGRLSVCGLRSSAYAQASSSCASSWQGVCASMAWSC